MSAFAVALKGLLDDTGFFTRKQWEVFYGRIGVGAIDAWLAGEKLPAPYLLAMTLDLLDNSSGIPAGPRDAFKALLDKPISEISSFKVTQTLRQYIYDRYKHLGKVATA